MKKITLLLIFLFSLSGYCQFPEGFDNSDNLPVGWSVNKNTAGLSQQWKITSSSSYYCQGAKAAVIFQEGIDIGTTAENYLVTPQFTVPTNGQARFLARQYYDGDNGSKLQVRISTNSDPKSLASYTVLQEWTESDLLKISGDYTKCGELKVNLSNYVGQKVYLAFVRVFTQTSDPNKGGDRWSVDNVNVVSLCADPTLGVATYVSATTATLDWTSTTGSSWDIEYVLPGDSPTGNPTVTGVNAKPYKALNLTPDTAYTFYVRAVCGAGNTSNWAGPFSFKTYPFGSLCDGAIAITSLPYQAASNTAIFPNLLNGPQNPSSLCGADPAGLDYLGGNDVFYSYTAPTTGSINIKMTPTGPNSSIFVYNTCPINGPCLAGVANSDSTQRLITNFPVTAGSTYTIVISSTKATPTVGYTLIIQKETCTPPVGSVPVGDDLTTTTAKLSWTNPTGATEWQVAVQPLGDQMPTGSGVTVTNNSYLKEGLDAGTQYQYFVRSKCPSGDFSSWAGPYLFNTLICEDVNKCYYSFKMVSKGTSGWAGATMQVRQNGIVVQSIGSTFISGTGPSTVMVPMCKDLPFDLYWDSPGLLPNNCEVSIINSFGQTLFTKIAGSSAAGQVVYNNVVNCTKPVCDIPPIPLDATLIDTQGATLNWSAPATTTWDVYLVPQGSPAPNVLTTPNYVGITTNPLQVTGLLADTCYDYYVRVVCATKSNWSDVGTFCTLPTCPKPTGLKATGMTKTGATLGWVNGTVGDSKWEILLIKADKSNNYGTPAVPGVTPAVGAIYTVTAPSPFTVNNLDTATIYYYYIRTICSVSDKSVWAGPYKFNTVICDDINKCDYKFTMTDSGPNAGWDKSRMEIRQNGILVSKGNIGSAMTSSVPVTATLSLCNNLPIELVWTVAGDHQEEIGIQVVSPFGDPLYTKLPGDSAKPLDVLFQSTANCTNPTCPKPSALTVSKVTATTADLGWTENAAPAATQWEVYVVPASSPQPVNGSAVNNSYVTNKNPYTVTGLNPSTTYDFYVRSLCSGIDASNWTLLTSKRFTTPPVNDECDKSISVPVNNDENCVLIASGNTKGATASVPEATACPGFADDDVWFSFVATSKIHVIDISNISGGTDLNHTVYSGNDCANPTLLYCSNPNSSVATNLTVGSTYKIRIYSNDMTVLPTTFDVCITTPPAITNDDCGTAVTLDVNDDLSCKQSKAGSLIGATASLQANTCLGSADDDVWYKFIAVTTNHYITLNNVTGSIYNPGLSVETGSPVNLNHAVYTGDCGNLVLKYCSVGNTFSSNATDFVPGQTYYVRVWSNSPDPQKVNFNMCVGSVQPPLTTSTKFTAQQLVEDVLLGSKCANVTNVHSSTGTNFSSDNGIGYFNKSTSSFPFKDGIVLSTGSVLSVPGPNFSILKEGSKAWLGDTDLENIMKEAMPNQKVDSHNASVLEFDFIPLSEQLSFNFLFASEEYGAEQCGYADTFAFILSHTENGQVYKENLALLPNTNLPVSVLTIRDNKYNGACPSEHPELFDQYYLGDVSAKSPTNFNGFTVPLTAKANVKTGLTYHIKMVIADNKDTVWDSAVFLEGGSFEVGRLDFGVDLLKATNNAVCFGEKYVLNTGLDATKYSFVWKKNNVVIDGQTGPSLEIDSEGTYTLEAHYLEGICDTSDSIVVEYYPGAVPGTPLDIAVCSSSDTAVFDLTKNSDVILSPYNGDHTVDYYASADDANAEQNVIPDPTAFQNTVNPQTIYARVNMKNTVCSKIMTFTAKANLVPQFTVSGGCSSNAYELTTVSAEGSFDLAAATYEWTAANGGVFKSTDKANTIILNSKGTYNVKVTANGCSNVESITVGDISCSVPKGISPGSDTKNSSFDLSAMNVKRLEVFNRYGSEVYNKDNYTNEWHGQSNSGSDLPDGTYFYQIHTMDNKTTTGWVYINRKQS